MGGKRRRDHMVGVSVGGGDGGARASKRRATPSKSNVRDATDRRAVPPAQPGAQKHPVLSQYFPTVLTLRGHFRRVLTSHSARALRLLAGVTPQSDAPLCTLLDTALVGVPDAPASLADRVADATHGAVQGGRGCASPEVVDLALQTLFRRSLLSPWASRAIYPGKPNNILALGYVTAYKGYQAVKGAGAGPAGLDVVNTYPNAHISTLKTPPWTTLGQIVGDEPMLDLLLNTSVFIQCAGGVEGKENLYQLIGPPISDAKNPPLSANHNGGSPPSLGRTQDAGSSLRPTRSAVPRLAKTDDVRPNTTRLPKPAFATTTTELSHDLRTPGDILFVRSRLFYSKPSYNSRGQIFFGLRHIHVLNRYPKPEKSHTLHILKYIFPRQFRLHNVFTSVVDKKTTVQPFKDYIFREEEIALARESRAGKVIPIPNRLRGKVLELVRKLQVLHKKCPYHALVKYYCPVSLCDPGVQNRSAVFMGPCPSSTDDTSSLATQSIALSVTAAPESSATTGDSGAGPATKFTDFASTAVEVSAFAKAVVLKVIPLGFFGEGSKNRDIILQAVDKFIKLRRYESFSLHTALQGIKLTEIKWLRPPSTPPSTKMSQSDEKKRHQLLAEFVYWLFDSFLIPLLQSHFYATESNFHRNHVFYFRHDVWKKLCEPALNELKLKMFQEIPTDRAKKLLDSRQLGFSHIRLLPKEYGVRPILNLRKRGMVKMNGTRILTPSINTVMAPVFHVLSLERQRNPEKMGASMTNIGNMYIKVKNFQQKLRNNGWGNLPLYFAKVDVTGCFDTIPQQGLLDLIETVLEDEEYWLVKYGEVRMPPANWAIPRNGFIKPWKRWLTQARPIDQLEPFADFTKRALKPGKTGTVLVDDVVYKAREKDTLLDLLDQHVKDNIVKIGRKYFRQKTGIPQGSVLSTILCNLFYAQMEHEKLPFTADEDGLLLRLVDDFLFITLNHDNAKRFLQVMHDGNPEYGAFVKPEKTLVNFEVSINNKKIVRVADTMEFPYCGNVIHMKTLNIHKDWGRKLTNVEDMLSVEYSRKPGSALFRKTVNAVKVLVKGMYLDTTFNSLETVFKNIYHIFVEVAMKFHRYVKALTHPKRPTQQRLISAVFDVLQVAFVIFENRQKNSGGLFHCAVTQAQVKWLGTRAFKDVLRRKQSGYKELLRWLEDMEEDQNSRLKGKAKIKAKGLDLASFATYRY